MDEEKILTNLGSICERVLEQIEMDIFEQIPFYKESLRFVRYWTLQSVIIATLCS